MIMKKGLKVTLAAVAITLLCGAAFSYAPLIKDIPDIYIGDAEDNVGSTVDLNIFRFSDAINFDVFVYGDPGDDDFYTTGVRWSFQADSDELLTINGINTLDILGGDDPLEPAAKELSGYPNFSEPFDQVPDATKPDEKGRASSWADFYDLKDTDIVQDPVGDPLDTVITVFASNGTKVSSKEVIVRALDGGEDALSGGVSVDDLITWDTPNSDGFTRHSLSDGFYITAADGSFYIAGHSTSGEKIGISGHATRNVYGAWYSPAADNVDYFANSVYRVKYTIESTAAADAAPLCRLLSYIKDSSDGGLVNGGNRLGKGPFQPDADGEEYNVYLDAGNLSTGAAVGDYFSTSFELIDFDPAEEGINYVSEIQVQKFDTPDKSSGTPVISYNTQGEFSTWSSQVMRDFITAFGEATCGSDTNGLYIETPLAVTSGATAISYGKWTSATGDASFEADKLYRAVFTLAANNASDDLGKIRVVMSNGGNNWQAMYVLLADATHDHFPTTSGNEYSVWQESPPSLYTGGDAAKNGMYFIFDVSDGEASQSGRVYLEKLEVLYYDIP